VNKPINLYYFYLCIHIFSIFLFFIYFWGLGPAQPMWGLGWTQPARPSSAHVGAGPSQPGPAWSLAQASDPAGPNQIGGTRGVSPRVHALCEGN